MTPTSDESAVDTRLLTGPAAVTGADGHVGRAVRRALGHPERDRRTHSPPPAPPTRRTGGLVPAPPSPCHGDHCLSPARRPRTIDATRSAAVGCRLRPRTCQDLARRRVSLTIAAWRVTRDLEDVSFPLDASKLTPPFARSGIVERTALLRRLAAEPTVPVVGVVAPAGYGKSTVLRQWADHSARPTAWLTLDSDDNDPVVLLTYLAATLDGVAPVDVDLFSMLAVEQPSVRTIARALGAALTASPRPGALVIDDVHVLDNPGCHDVIAMLADHVPPGSQLALASRTGLSLPMPRLRGEGRILEITPDDLALDDTEAAALLTGAGIALEQPAVHDLVDVTEGWPAAIYLAGRSIRARGTSGRPDLARIGRSREIVAYAHSELLAALPDDAVQFLTRSSVLHRLSGPLCDAVLESSDSAARLEDLAESSLLVIPLDDHRRWYRYHHLLRDLLREELDRREPALAPRLARRAATWCQANGQPDEAIDYAMAAGDPDLMACIVQARMLPAYRQGRTATVTRWFDWLDDGGHMPRYPSIAVGATWLAALTGRAGAAERWADAAEHPAPERPGLHDRPALEGELALLRVMLFRGGVTAAVADAEISERLIPLDSPWRPVAFAMSGIVRLTAGADEDADTKFVEAVQLGRETGGAGAASVALSERALIALRRTDEDEARMLARDACAVVLDERLQDLATNVFVFAVAARMAMLNGDVADARKRIVQAQRLRPRLSYAIPHLAVQARLELVRTLLSLSDVAGARTVLREVDDILLVRPTLGAFVDEAKQLRVRVAGAPASTVGASSLTAAELRLLPLLQTHLTFREIGERLFVSRHTVKTQAVSIYRKLGVSSRSDAMRAAARIGLLPD